MSKCNKCSNGTMQEAKLVTRQSDTAVLDIDDNDIIIEGTHEKFANNDPEIGTYSDIWYCSCGRKWGR